MSLSSLIYVLSSYFLDTSYLIFFEYLFIYLLQIGAFLALSMTSLVFSISMLVFYSVVLEYFLNLIRVRCSYYYGCYQVMTSVDKNLAIGIASCLVGLALFDMACSIGSVVVSCKAYSKFCNTCDVNDCCSYLGCCECDCIPLNTLQVMHMLFFCIIFSLCNSKPVYVCASVECSNTMIYHNIPSIGVKS